MVALRRNPDRISLSNIGWEFDWEVLLLQEVEDWHLELCEREPPGLADKVTEAIEALVAGRRMDHIKGWTLHNSGTQTDARRHPLPDPVRLRAKRQALLVADTKIPIAEHRYGPMDQKQEWRMSEKKPTARLWSP